MLHWITENLSTIIVSAILLAIIIATSVYLIRQRKKGRSSCGCNCVTGMDAQWVEVLHVTNCDTVVVTVANYLI